ncbi:DUF333 domain-containing protein [Dickeya chrysanthemi]|uniref:DUF333 domain-containing protein n=1 Tax=Dickeya chrysanthemi TaxID=556 RepID=A0ABU8JKP2_DICCH|nr:DUF333 domain-containing protein [Dickeya chrysanthemi]MCA7007664.1 DUF333 domain-containing protein [Dickeya chrysanthemi]
MNMPQWLVAGATLMLVACSGGQTESASVPEAVAPQRAVWQGQGSPAEVNCTLAGGRMGFSRQLNGASIGTCLLANGKRCSETALMNGSCPAG